MKKITHEDVYCKIIYSSKKKKNPKLGTMVMSCHERVA